MRGRKSPNWGKGEKQLHSRTQWTYARFVNEKERVHVLTIPIMCTIPHFQWKCLPQSVMEVQFPGYRHFVLPTHNTVSWGTWLRAGSLKSVLVSILDPDQTKLTKTLNSSKIAYPSFHPPIKTTTMTRTISSSESAHLAWRLPFTPLTNNTFIPWKQFSCIASNTLQCFIFLLLTICLTNIFWPDSTVRELVGFVEQMQQMQI